MGGQLIDGVTVTGALQADVQAGQGEPEDVNLIEQGVELFTAQLGADEAVADQFKVAAELIDVRVVQRFMAGIPRWEPWWRVRTETASRPRTSVGCAAV